MSVLQQAPTIRTNVQPGAIAGFGASSVPGVSAGPGSSLRPVGLVPGPVIGRPGDRLPSGGRRNKSGQSSNEPIVTTIIVDVWPVQHYEQYQQVGDLLFIRTKETGNGHSFPTINVAQLNEMLQICFNKIQALDRLQPQRKYGPTSVDNVPLEVSNGVMELLHEFQQHGEGVFEGAKNWNNLCNDKQFSQFVGISSSQIKHFYKYLGLYASDGGRYAKPHFTYNIMVGGPTTYQEAFNLWGPLTEGHNVFLILTRRNESTAGVRKYGAFYFKPWYGREDYPPKEERVYFDEAGVQHFGDAVPVGRVYRTPLEKCDSLEQRNIKAGITATSQESFQTRITTVSLVLGPRRVCRDLFYYAA